MAKKKPNFGDLGKIAQSMQEGTGTEEKEIQLPEGFTTEEIEEKLNQSEEVKEVNTDEAVAVQPATPVYEQTVEQSQPEEDGMVSISKEEYEALKAAREVAEEKALEEASRPRINTPVADVRPEDFSGQGGSIFSNRKAEAYKEVEVEKPAATGIAPQVVVKHNYRRHISEKEIQKLAETKEFVKDVLSDLRDEVPKTNDIFFSPFILMDIPEEDVKATINGMLNKSKEILHGEMPDLFPIEELAQFNIDSFDIKYLKSPRTGMNLKVADLKASLYDSILYGNGNPDDPINQDEAKYQADEIASAYLGKNVAMVSGAKSESCSFLTISFKEDTIPTIKGKVKDPNLKIKALLSPLLEKDIIISSKTGNIVSYAISLVNVATFAQNLFTNQELADVDKEVSMESVQLLPDTLGLRATLSVRKSLINK